MASDSADYSYSYSSYYSGSEGDYYYSYSGSSTASADEKKAGGESKKLPPVGGGAAAKGSSGGSYSYSDYDYSYSYSDTDTAGPVAKNARGGAAAAADTGKKGSVGSGSYGDSYSYSGYDYSYSYSGSGSRSLTTDTYGSKKGSSSYDDYYYNSSYSYGDDDYYDYSYSDDSSRQGRRQRRDGGSGASSSAYSNYYSSYYDDDYYYSGSYSGSSYSYPYSDDGKGGSGSGESYYASTYYDNYSSSSYYSGSGKTGDTNYYSDYDYSSYDSYYDDDDYSSATKKTTSSTTSSYYYTSETSSVEATMTPDTEKDAMRDLVVLRAPAKDIPAAPPAPKRCFITSRSSDDLVWACVLKLKEMQTQYEAGKAANIGTGVEAPSAPLSATEVVNPDEKPSKKSKKKPARGSEAPEGATAGAAASFVPTKDGCASERTLRIAFNLLGMNHLERKEALHNAPIPLPFDVLAEILHSCVSARVKEKVAQAFLSHDKYRSGELSLLEMGGLLRRMGVGTSPILSGFRVSVDVSTSEPMEMLLHAERLVSLTPEGPSNTANDAAHASDASGLAEVAAAAAVLEVPAAQWEVVPIAVGQIIKKNVAAKRPTAVQWRHNSIYMGSHVIFRDVCDEALFQRLKTYIESATYLCVLADVYSIHDAETKTVSVMYPFFIRSVLLAQQPTTSSPKLRKNIFIQNFFRGIYSPLEQLEHYATGKRSLLYYGEQLALESTLQSTRDTEEKRRRNAVPAVTLSKQDFIPAPTMRGPEELQMQFLVEQVRMTGLPPEHSRCFCLVSAVTPENVFLPAVELPMLTAASSKKTGCVWAVDGGKQAAQTFSVIQYVGAAVDRIYMEFCYEAKPEPEAPATGVTAVWSAGYALLPVNGAASTTLPVVPGSLLQASEGGVSVGPGLMAGAVSAAAEPGADPEKKKKLFSCCASMLKKKKQVSPAVVACSVTVKVLKAEKLASTREDLPTRYIAMKRHLPMVISLRGAIRTLGKTMKCASQTLRHQAAQYIFAVAADAILLDQLAILWDYKVKHFRKSERKDDDYRQQQLLRCVGALYGLYSCSAGSKHHFAEALKKGKALQIKLDEEPLRKTVAA